MAAELDAALARFRDRIGEPRAYGINDCCIAVADVLDAAHGGDLMALFGRRYRSASGFLRAIRKQGCATVSDAIEFAALHAGWRPLCLDKEAAQDFDLGLVWSGHDGAVFKVPAFLHDGAWRGLTQDGAVFSFEAVKGWRHG